jgi:hypothetical protein
MNSQRVWHKYVIYKTKQESELAQEEPNEPTVIDREQRCQWQLLSPGSTFGIWLSAGCDTLMPHWHLSGFLQKSVNPR